LVAPDREEDGEAREEIDPELVKLRRSVPVGPILVACVLGFSLLLMFRLRHDLAYSRRGDQPTDLGDVRRAASLPDNAYVTLTGVPDLRAPGRILGIQDIGHRMAPFLGTGGRVWLAEAGDASTVTPQYDEKWTGRLQELDRISFADSLREYVAGLPPQPRTVFADALKGGALPTTDVDGDPLQTTPDTKVDVEERLLDAAVVTLVKTDTVTDEATARAALERAGLTATPTDKSATSWTFDVTGADAAAAQAKLRAARLFGAAADPKVRSHAARAADLAFAPGAVVVAGQSIQLAAVERVVFWVPPRLPDQAWVLLAGDKPAELWYMTPLYAVLAVIALLMIWALAVVVRHARNSGADSPV
jgi:hypothetical protein